jgi:hypothetical protein
VNEQTAANLNCALITGLSRLSNEAATASVDAADLTHNFDELSKGPHHTHFEIASGEVGVMREDAGKGVLEALRP